MSSSAKIPNMSTFSIKESQTGFDGHDVAFFAESNQTGILGSVFAGLVDETVRLDSIQANPPVRGQGIGSALLAAVLKWGREKGAKTIIGEFVPDPFSKPKDVEKFYNKFGIQIDENGNLRGDIK